MSLNYVSLGAKVKAIRKHRGFTQAALAEKVDCATTHISYIESGVKCKAPSYVIKFCGRSYIHISIIEIGHMI